MVRVSRDAWRVALALSCSLGVAFVASCSGKVESGPEAADGDGGFGRGGSSGSSGTVGRGSSGGSGRGGTSTGSGGSAGFSGSAGGFAGTAAGGAAGSGIVGSGGIHCDYTPGLDRCTECSLRECCSEFIGCGSDPDCGGDGEITCIQTCVVSTVHDGGIADDATVSGCARLCAHGVRITSATNYLLACLHTGTRADGGTGTDCFIECFGAD